ncbi:MAG: ATP-binding cassette domain-containing protein, partial [Candidatus Limnocylindrus sp.]
MSSADDGNIVMALKDVVVHYPVKEGVLQRVVDFVRAVDGVSLTIPRGQTLGLVGESGCGKTTLGKVIAGLVPATSGEIWFNVTRQDLDELDRLQRSVPGELSKVERERLGQLQSKHRLGGMAKEAHRRYRRNCQVVFQDAFASLNPRQLVRDIVGRPLRVYHEVSGKDLDRQVVDLLDQVGLGAQHLLRNQN